MWSLRASTVADPARRSLKNMALTGVARLFGGPGFSSDRVDIDTRLEIGERSRSAKPETISSKPLQAFALEVVVGFLICCATMLAIFAWTAASL